MFWGSLENSSPVQKQKQFVWQTSKPVNGWSIVSRAHWYSSFSQTYVQKALDPAGKLLGCREGRKGQHGSAISVFSPSLHLAKGPWAPPPGSGGQGTCVAAEFRGLSAPGQVRAQILLVGDQLAGARELLGSHWRNLHQGWISWGLSRSVPLGCPSSD